jgi:hypothetical protein
MNSHSVFGSIRLGGTALAAAAIFSFNLSSPALTAEAVPGATGTAQPLAATQSDQFMERLGAGNKKPSAKLPNDSAEAGMLREAYARLAVADHDYSGHRAKAMGEIKNAAKALGVELGGDGKGHEPQATSDEHLRAALGLLQQITGAVTGTGLKRIQAAEQQLNIALSLK